MASPTLPAAFNLGAIVHDILVLFMLEASRPV